MKKNNDLQKLREQAATYEQCGDHYHAIKLWKLIVRHDPEDGDAFLRLGRIYKGRKEWKPALHYLKKGLAQCPDDQEAWWDVGLVATALGRKKLARITWNKFGWNGDNPFTGGIISIRTDWGSGYELLWGRRVSPALAFIGSVPWPASGLCFRDQVLVDGLPSGWQVVNRKKYPVFDEVGLYKKSDYKTWSCRLSSGQYAHLQLLERLCRESGLGFENWTNTSFQKQVDRQGALPEYYHPGTSFGTEEEVTVALAARDEDEVRQALTAWAIITYEDYGSLTAY